MNEAQTFYFDSSEQADACRLYWQRVLRLQDWQVDVRIVEHGDLPGDLAGECEMSFSLKRAHIKILNKQALELCHQMSRDQERILVHEILHMAFCGIQPDAGTTEMDLLEQSIECLAGALVALNRRQQ